MSMEPMRNVSIRGLRKTSTEPLPNASDETLATLRRLIAVCHESEHGLRTAGRHATLACFRATLCKYARQRAQLAAELAREASHLDEEEAGDHSGPIATGPRGLWSSVTTTTDDLALISLCERAEEATRRSFEEARTRPLPAPLATLLATHHHLITEAVSHLQSIRAH